MSGNRKALISPGYGAGWSTWNPEYRTECLFDEALIATVEHLGPGDYLTKDSPVVQDFIRRLVAKYGEGAQHIYCGGLDGVRVDVIEGQFRVDEYDGNESVITRDEDKGWV